MGTIGQIPFCFSGVPQGVSLSNAASLLIQFNKTIGWITFVISSCSSCSLPQLASGWDCVCVCLGVCAPQLSAAVVYGGHVWWVYGAVTSGWEGTILMAMLAGAIDEQWVWGGCG